MTPYLIAAFLGGAGAKLLRLPPLIGFLAAGFVLNALGYELTDWLQEVGDLGVTLLLFTIGLKLRVKTLLKGEVWGVATLHIVGCTALIMAGVWVLKFTGLDALQGLSLPTLALIGFSLSFSSTVLAIKVLESTSETASLMGRVAIGILVMQDIFAVAFLTASTGKVPSVWALLLVLLLPAGVLFRAILDRLGHGELQVLFGVFMALVAGYALFSGLGLKGDLGALLIGMLLAPAASAGGLSKSLFNLKELLLVGFFLTIGLTELPTWETAAIAVALLLFLPLKGLLFLVLLMRFHLRTRSALLASVTLTNYSEFGLIVAALAVSAGWLEADWLVIFALTAALSFLLATPLSKFEEQLYRFAASRLSRLQTGKTHPSEQPLDVGDADVVMLGMGRIGRGAYDTFTEQYGLKVLGIDSDDESIAGLRAAGYNVIEADASNSDFWEKLLVTPTVQLIVLAMPNHAGNLYAMERMRDRQVPAKIAAVVRYDDEIEPLRAMGAAAVFHAYAEAGHGLASDAVAVLGLDRRSESGDPSTELDAAGG